MSDLQPNTFVDVPDLKCPECAGPLSLAIVVWETATGVPSHWHVSCATDEDETCDDEDHGCGGTHRYYQSDWQLVIDAAESWGRAQGFRVPT